MGRLQWGLIGAVIAVIAVVLLAMQGVFTNGDVSDQTADSSEMAAQRAADDVAADAEQGEETRQRVDDVADDAVQEDESRQAADDVADDAVQEDGSGQTADDVAADPEQGEETRQRADDVADDSGQEDGSGQTADDVADDAGQENESRQTADDVADDSGQENESRQTADEVADDAGQGDESGQTSDDVADDPGRIEEPRRTAAADEGEPAGSDTASGDGDASDSPAAEDEFDEALQAEAESFVRELAEPSDEPVPVESAEGFVGPDRILKPEGSGSGPPAATQPEAGETDEAVSTGPDDAAEADAAIIAQSESTDAGAMGATRPDDRGERSEDAASPEADAVEAGEAPESAARETSPEDARPDRVDLPLSEQAPVTIAELLGAEEVIPSDAVFYVHTVRPEDDRGIWGIVHDGIVENFAEGVAVHRGETTETYRVDIPPDADQLRPDSSSSFLGRIIYEKSQKTYVYNYQTDRLGRNPDLIIPGQEIVIVSFTPEELVEIYKYFVGDS